MANLENMSDPSPNIRINITQRAGAEAVPLQVENASQRRGTGAMLPAVRPFATPSTS
jgi:hypothetical protein